MKSIVRSALAAALPAALLVSLPAPAGVPAAGAPAASAPAAQPSPAVAAVQALLRELQLPDDRTLPATERIERIAGARPSAETEERLRAVFGTDRLYTLERQPAQPGRVDWRLTVPALHHAPAEGTAYDWTEGTLDLQYNPAGTTALVRGGWGLLAAEDGEARVALRGLTLDSRQKRGPDKLWFGDTRLRLAGADVHNKANGTVVGMTDLGIDVGVTDKGRTATLNYDARIGRIAVAGEQVDDLRLAFRLTNIDRPALVALSEAGARGKPELQGLTPQQQLEVIKPLLRTFGQAALARGTAIEIDDISAGYRGARASIKGRVAVEGGTEADLDDARAFMRKIVARFDVRLPIALVREIAGKVAAQQAAQQGKPTDPESLAQLRQSIADIAVGKLVGGGFARLEDDVLVSTVEWRGGELRANGKPVPLPAPPSPDTAQPPVAMAPRGAEILQARRLDGSCTMPDYPEEVVRGDLPLALAFSFVVGADGKVKTPVVTRASKYPDYDRAALAALAQCAYAPPLRGGKPFDLATSWRLVRVPGTQRP